MITPMHKESKYFSMPLYPQNKSFLEYSKSETSENLFNSLSDSEKKIYSRQEKLFCNQKKRKELKKSSVHKFSKSKTLRSETSPIFHRVFLSQLGFFDSENIQDLTPIANINQSIEEIDKALEKELILFPVFYLLTPEDKENSIISNNNGYTVQFQQFLNNLGTPLSKESNTFKHLNSTVSKFDKIIYKNCGLFESIVVSPALISSKKFNFLGFISKFPIIVFWNQRANDKYSRKIPNIIEFINLEKTIAIVLTHISDSLTLVNIYKDSHKPGPLLNQMIIPNIILPNLLLFTIYNCQASIDTYTNPWERRRSIIKQKSESKKNLESFLNYLFN